MANTIRGNKLINKSELARRAKLHPSYISLIFSNKRKAAKTRKRLQKIIARELTAA